MSKVSLKQVKELARLKSKRHLVDVTIIAEIIEERSSNVSYYIKEHGLPQYREGEFDLIEVVKWYTKRLREKIKITNLEEIQEAKMLQFTARARKLDIETKILEKSVIPMETVIEELAVMVETLKANLQRASVRIAEKGVKETNSDVLYNLVDEEHIDALNEVAKTLKKLTAPVGIDKEKE